MSQSSGRRTDGAGPSERSRPRESNSPARQTDDPPLPRRHSRSRERSLAARQTSQVTHPATTPAHSHHLAAFPARLDANRSPTSQAASGRRSTSQPPYHCRLSPRSPTGRPRTPNPPQRTIGSTATDFKPQISSGPPADLEKRPRLLFQSMKTNADKIAAAAYTPGERRSARTPRAPNFLAGHSAEDLVSNPSDERKPKREEYALAAAKIKISLQIENELYLTHPKRFDSFENFSLEIFKKWRRVRVADKSQIGVYSEGQFLISVQGTEWKVTPRDRLPPPPDQLCCEIVSIPIVLANNSHC